MFIYIICVMIIFIYIMSVRDTTKHMDIRRIDSTRVDTIPHRIDPYTINVNRLYTSKNQEYNAQDSLKYK